jgi:hypothetical protein
MKRAVRQGTENRKANKGVIGVASLKIEVELS